MKSFIFILLVPFALFSESKKELFKKVYPVAVNLAADGKKKSAVVDLISFMKYLNKKSSKLKSFEKKFVDGKKISSVDSEYSVKELVSHFEELYQESMEENKKNKAHLYIRLASYLNIEGDFRDKIEKTGFDPDDYPLISSLIDQIKGSKTVKKQAVMFKKLQEQEESRKKEKSTAKVYTREQLIKAGSEGDKRLNRKKMKIDPSKRYFKGSKQDPNRKKKQ